MLKKISKIKGITLLSKEEQRKTHGTGTVYCIDMECESDDDCQFADGFCNSGVCDFPNCNG
ncbi:hypothetical protein [Ascidiimonas aurantiaca]|uniref:hypothetical protein n=1 Tax=Ascidiimonas aurantiaca TaxID=1685432 RepID=UPI0030EC81FA